MVLGRSGAARALWCVAAVVIGWALTATFPVGADALPAGWAYELASPPDTNGQDVSGGIGSADGDHAWLIAFVPIVPGQATGNTDTIAVTRTSSGWVAHDLAQDLGAPSDDSASLAARSADSRRVLIAKCPITLVACPSGFTDFLRLGPGGERTLMLRAPIHHDAADPSVVGSSDDLSWVFFHNHQTYGPLLPAVDTHTKGNGLYGSHDGQLVFLGYDENGNVLDCGAIIAKGTAVRGTGFQQGGVSADGLTVTYESPDPTSGCPGPKDIYVRRDGVTRVASRATGVTDEGADYIGSSRDGTIAYYITTSQLATADTDTLSDIYRYDYVTNTITPVTIGAGVTQAVVAPTGNTIYFTASVALEGHGTNGLANFYRADLDGADPTIHYITTATTGDIYLGGGYSSNRLALATPDGQHLLFTATSALTGQPTGGLPQLFRYSTPENSLTCLTCHTDGTIPNSAFSMDPLAPNGNVDQRLQSDDGSTVAFATNEALLPQDINGKRDVYLWHDGQTSLISTGRASTNSQLATINAAGTAVLFTSFERLVPQAISNNRKLYEARLGGGFPFNPPALGCDGDTCQHLPTPAPELFGGGGSSTYRGIGNTKGRTRVAVSTPSKGALRRLERTGKLTLTLHTNRAGSLRILVTATLNHHTKRLANLRRTARKPGRITLTINVPKTLRHPPTRLHITATTSARTYRRTIKL